MTSQEIIDRINQLLAQANIRQLELVRGIIQDILK